MYQTTIQHPTTHTLLTEHLGLHSTAVDRNDTLFEGPGPMKPEFINGTDDHAVYNAAGAGPAAAAAGAQVPACKGGPNKARKGLTPAQLRASRNFRARRKMKMADMEDELKEKQQLVAQLEAEQQRLSRKAHALEVVVGGSESTQELLMQQLSELAVSEDSDLSSYSYSQHLDSSITRSNSASTSASTSASSHVQPGADQTQDIDPAVIELAEQYTHFVQQARPLLQELDAGRGGPETRKQVEQLMEELHEHFHRLALNHRTKVYGLGSINMQTLTKCEPPPEAHWRRVIAAWQLPAASREGLLACYDVYESKRAELLQARDRIAKALAAATSAAEQQLSGSSNGGGASASAGMNDGSGSLGLADASYEELLAEMDSNLRKEHVLEHTFQNTIYTFLEREDVARLCVLTYPYKHDIHKLVPVMKQS